MAWVSLCSVIHSTVYTLATASARLCFEFETVFDSIISFLCFSRSVHMVNSALEWVWETQARIALIYMYVQRWTSRRDRLQVNTYDTWCLVCLQTSGGNVYKTHGTSRKLYHFSDSISEVRLFPNIQCCYTFFAIFFSFGFNFISIHFSTGQSQFGKSN